ARSSASRSACGQADRQCRCLWSTSGTALAARRFMRFHFEEPVVAYMNRDLEIAHLDTPVERIVRTMHARGISGLPVLDGKGTLVGVVTRTDLIKLGLMQ